MARESLRSGAEHVWWLYLDSDEFPEGPSGLSLREYLATLDRRFRVVGSACVNHLPTAKPEFIPGFHPIDFQPNCYEFEPRWTPICGQRHWKHPLQRIDRGAHFIVSRAGSHWGICPDELIEPEGGIVTHHFQYRDEALTRAKLDLTCGPGSRRTALYGGSGQDGFNRRRRSLDAVYAQAWDDVEIEVGTTLAATDGPRPWPDADERPALVLHHRPRSSPRRLALMAEIPLTWRLRARPSPALATRRRQPPPRCRKSPAPSSSVGWVAAGRGSSKR